MRLGRFLLGPDATLGSIVSEPLDVSLEAATAYAAEVGLGRFAIDGAQAGEYRIDRSNRFLFPRSLLVQRLACVFGLIASMKRRSGLFIVPSDWTSKQKRLQSGIALSEADRTIGS